VISPQIQATLSRIEHEVGVVSLALTDGEPIRLESVSKDLCAVSRELHGLLTHFNDSLNRNLGLEQRLKALISSISVLREGLSRRTVSIDRALFHMLPSAQTPIYPGSAGPYGRSGRQSGAFTVLAA
jgi:hypothetical protein